MKRGVFIFYYFFIFMSSERKRHSLDHTAAAIFTCYYNTMVCVVSLNFLTSREMNEREKIALGQVPIIGFWALPHFQKQQCLMLCTLLSSKAHDATCTMGTKSHKNLRGALLSSIFSINFKRISCIFTIRYILLPSIGLAGVCSS